MRWFSPPKPFFQPGEIQEAAQRIGADLATKAGKEALSGVLKKGLASKTGGTFARIRSMLGYSLFLAFFQYIITALVSAIQKPDVPKDIVFKRSFIAAGISFLFSMAFIVAFTIVANVIPPVRAVLLFAENLPIVGRLMNENMYFAIALSPLHMLSSLAAHGISCSFMNAPPPPSTPAPTGTTGPAAEGQNVAPGPVTGAPTALAGGQ
jgi:hypothetical protein